MWVDHEDRPCSIREHHALTDVMGSSAIRQMFTGEQPSAESADMGNAVAWLVYTCPTEWDSESAVVIERPSFRGQPDKLRHWKATHPENIGLTKTKMLEARQMADAVQAHEFMRALIGCGELQAEHTVIARDEETGILAKARPDFRLPGVRNDDLKISALAEPGDYVRAVRNYGYDVQGALYEGIDCDRYGLTELPEGYNLIVVSSKTLKVGVFGLKHWLPRGRRILRAGLRMRAHLLATGKPIPTMWEVPQQLPGPTRWDDTIERRMLSHADHVCSR